MKRYTELRILENLFNYFSVFFSIAPFEASQPLLRTKDAKVDEMDDRMTQD